VEIITKTYYKTSDGKEFATQKEAEDHESLRASLVSILKPLGKRPTLKNEEFIQHDINVVNTVYQRLFSFCKDRKPREIIWDRVTDDFSSESTNNISYAIDRFGIDSSIVVYVWNRLACIDNSGREFNQPYFAITKDAFEATPSIGTLFHSDYI